VFNVGSGKATTWLQLARTTCSLVHGSSDSCRTQASSSPARRRGHVQGSADVSATEQHLGIKVAITLSDGLQRTLAWLQHELAQRAMPPSSRAGYHSIDYIQDRGVVSGVKRHGNDNGTSYDVVFASYFTTSADPQRMQRRNGNRFAYIRGWYRSCKRYCYPNTIIELLSKYCAILDNFAFYPSPLIASRCKTL